MDIDKKERFAPWHETVKQTRAGFAESRDTRKVAWCFKYVAAPLVSVSAAAIEVIVHRANGCGMAKNSLEAATSRW